MIKCLLKISGIEPRILINKIYGELEEEICNPDSDQSPLTLQLRARQKTEAFKVPLMTEMTTDLLEEGKSVVIFVNFQETFDRLVAAFPGCAEISGKQLKEEDRTFQIDRFQNNEAHVMVAMMQAGGVGVSLHDLTGERPRVSLLSPSYSARHLKQALGRIPRKDGLSKCIQRIIYAAGTVEEEACKAIHRKLDNIDMLNDGDLSFASFFKT